VDYANVSLRDLIRRVYEVKEYQVSGPDWMKSARFDIVAKIPSDTPKEQVPLMLQTLLAERFKLAIHRETKDLPMYALVVGRNGPKMKESLKEPEIDPNAPPAGSGFDGGGRIPIGKDG